MEHVTLTSIAAIAVQTIIILIGFCSSYMQLRQQALDLRAQTTIEIKKLFKEYRDITNAFRPQGDWAEEIPVDSYVWGTIDEYLGLFEHLEYLISNKMLDLEFVKKSHSVKLCNALLHKDVYEKITSIEEKDDWEDLFSLCKRMGIDLDEIKKEIYS